MHNRSPKLVLNCRKDRLWLRKRYCQRLGLPLRKHPRRRKFGYVGCYVDIPSEFSIERALRAARALKSQSKLLKLGHVAGALRIHAGKPEGRARLLPPPHSHVLIEEIGMSAVHPKAPYPRPAPNRLASDLSSIISCHNNRP